ncbi:MAG: hypothetical protein JKX94_12465 [Sneathiella sp.]|nr:hypothetical protein [Sneathiella sp.]
MAETLHPFHRSKAPSCINNPYYGFHIDHDVNCVFVKHTNKLTLNLIYDRYEDIFAHPMMRPNLNYFVDYSECDNQMVPDDIRNLSKFLVTKQVIRGRGRHAVLCSNSVGYGYSRMLDSLYNASRQAKKAEIITMIYNAEDYVDNEEAIKEAMIWLGINPDYERPF